MSAQRLSARSIRRIQRDLDEQTDKLGGEIVMAWSHGGYTMAFVTADHRHGSWDKKTRFIEFATFDAHWRCYSTCPRVGDSIRVWADRMRLERDERVIHCIGDQTGKPFCQTPHEPVPQMVDVMIPIPDHLKGMPMHEKCTKVWAKWWLDDDVANESLAKRKAAGL